MNLEFLALGAGCPDCELGIEARRRVFGPEFLPNLAIALAPFVVVLLIAWGIVRFLNQRRQGD